VTKARADACGRRTRTQRDSETRLSHWAGPTALELCTGSNPPSFV